MENLLKIENLKKDEVLDIFETAKEIKQKPEDFSNNLENRSLVMIFQKPSTRTRLSLQIGMGELGGQAVNLSVDESQISRGESLKDTAEVTSCYADFIAARFEKQSKLQKIAQNSNKPVINALTDRFHPCQALSDFFTLREKDISGKLTYVGDYNNVARSLINAAKLLDREINLAVPKDSIDSELPSKNIKVFKNAEEAVENSKIIYTDKWTSMSDPKKDISKYKCFQVDKALMNKSDNAHFMHCLPAERGKEVTSKVIDGPKSIVYEQAENRKHVQKSILLKLLEK